MFFAYSNIFFKILGATAPTKKTKVIVDNLDGKCTVFCKDNNFICTEYKLEKLVFKIKTNNESYIALDLDDNHLTLMHLQHPCIIEGYNKNGKLVLRTRIEDAKNIGLDLEKNLNASFQFSSESMTQCLIMVGFREEDENVKSKRREVECYDKFFYYNTPEEKTFLIIENDKYVLLPENIDGKSPNIFTGKSSPEPSLPQITSKKKIEFSTNKDLFITLRFIRSIIDA
ncbi:uncharacterized protein VNE69_01305 [Vairimorpha necatrix]|uniref:Uncharacterized protein n=1 Tax=Vairimorpha necatrix TaxID=6039 RepID=A0AAX4J8R9_9MICR